LFDIGGFSFSNVLLSYFFLRFIDILRTLEIYGLVFIFQKLKRLLSILSAPEMQRNMFATALGIIFVQVVPECFDDHISFLFLLHLKRNCKLEGQVVLLDSALGNEFHILRQHRFGDHCVFGLHQ